RVFRDFGAWPWKIRSLFGNSLRAETRKPGSCSDQVSDIGTARFRPKPLNLVRCPNQVQVEGGLAYLGGSPPRSASVISLAAYLDVEVVAAAALAIWVLARYPSFGPTAMLPAIA